MSDYLLLRSAFQRSTGLSISIAILQMYPKKDFARAQKYFQIDVKNISSWVMGKLSEVGKLGPVKQRKAKERPSDANTHLNNSEI
jgi:hypothetical protein